LTLPQEDKYYGTKAEMQEKIALYLGGRAAEKLTLDDISTGASHDIMRATEIAREMVTKYGFSDKLGMVNYSSQDEVFLGRDFTSQKNYSEEIASEIDEEIKILIGEAFIVAEKILKKNLKKLHIVAAALLEIETLDGEQFEDLMAGALTVGQLTAQKRKEEELKKERDAIEAAETEQILAEAVAAAAAAEAVIAEEYGNGGMLMANPYGEDPLPGDRREPEPRQIRKAVQKPAQAAKKKTGETDKDKSKGKETESEDNNREV
jgi:cell division protease FtsH